MTAPEVAPALERSDVEAFVDLPYGLHRQDPEWTPMLRRDVRLLLDPARNPFFEHADRRLFLARLGGRVVGRVAAIHDRLHEETHRDGAGFFGFFEAIDDATVSGALFAAAAGWLRGRGRERMRGPLNPSINDEAGLLVEGFSTPSVLMMPHNPRYYPSLVEAAGFRKAKDLLAFQSTGTLLPERLVAATDVVRRRYHVSLRPMDMRRFAEEVALIQRLFNAGWERNWGYVPLTDREIDHLAGQLKPLVVPQLVAFAEAEGEAIGFAAAIPDFNVALRKNPSGRLFPGILRILWASRRITRLRVLLLGVLPAWQARGVDALLYRHIWDHGRAKGFDWAEAGWILEDNHAMINGLTRMGFEVYKTYRIYERPI
ncbi:MAG TPA: N-acetyltransferase [Vicinamibacteria bacterium]|nr:N-acetyltransferase [Vicinamibacteria bacterium]